LEQVGLVKNKDVMQAVKLLEVDGCEAKLDVDWDHVTTAK
jgi:hypothetical protein